MQQAHGIFGEPRMAITSANRPDQTCRVPSGTTGELFALEQYNVLLPQLGQVIGNTGAGYSSADDNGACLARKEF